MDELIYAFLLPLSTGAVAGFLINFALEKDKARQRRKKILIALRAQAEALPRIGIHNQSAMESRDRQGHLLPMAYPVAPFELAIFSDDAISVSDDTLAAATDYLLKARELNAVIGILHRDHLQRLHGQAAPQNLHVTRLYLSDQEKDEMPRRIRLLRSYLDSEQSSWWTRLWRNRRPTRRTSNAAA